MKMDIKSARETLNNIVTRRNIIAHNADFDESSNTRKSIDAVDTKAVIVYLNQLVEAVDSLIQ